VSVRLSRLTLLTALTLLSVLALPAGPSAAPTESVISAEQVRVYALGPGDPMELPTTVAVGPDGEVFVADGVNDRVVRFARDGSLVGTIRRVAGQRLSRPTGVAVSGDGRIWIADGDHRRVVVVPPSGPGFEVPLGPELEGALDITDLDVTDDGGRLWLVDNDGHRLLAGDLDRGTWRSHGRLGDQWGEVRYPFMVAVHPDGGAVVSDTLNARLQGWTADGRAQRPVGTYGVSPGQLFRPKGVASTEDGRTWVSDGTLGVIQVFDHSGRFIDILREPSGQILRLDQPMGIEVVDDRLYVVERGAGRVREFALSERPGDVYQAVRRRSAWSEDRGRECSICHLEFMPAFEGGGAGALIPVPEDSLEQPWVSTEASCLSCHDGTVKDSRRLVFATHGHPVGDAPPSTMEVPEQLPLADGKVACRTCHSAHTLAGSGETHGDAMLLRVEDRPSELCVGCHGAEGPGDPGPGRHPLGELPLAGSTDDGPIECLDCHGSHSPEPMLLAPGLGAGTCVECHQGTVARSGAPGEHVRGAARLEPAARAAVEERGGLFGPSDGITCLTCHGVHRPSRPSSGCADCHVVAPPAADGELQPHSGDACVECHGVHRGGRRSTRRVASPGDPGGCLSCHGEGARHAPEQARPGEQGHALIDLTEAAADATPRLESCESCHGPAHEARRVDAASCEGCHDAASEGRVAGGHGGATCLDCHPAHLPSPSQAEATQDLNPAARRCLACHATGSDPERAGVQVAEYQHPSMVFLPDGQRWTPGGALQLYDPSGAPTPMGVNGDLVCGSCHTTHGPEGPSVRGLTRTGWQESCAACHGQDAMVVFLYFHQPERRERSLGPPAEGRVPMGPGRQPASSPEGTR
jgi:streptogramin lyase